MRSNAPEARNIGAKAALTGGMAAHKLGDEPDERRLRQIALDHGNEKARRISTSAVAAARQAMLA